MYLEKSKRRVIWNERSTSFDPYRDVDLAVLINFLSPRQRCITRHQVLDLW
jgi:hypothetical protein